MGKGDKKTKRGKIVIGSYGVKRTRKTSKPIPEKVVKVAKVAKIVEVAEVVEEVKPAAEKKTKAPKKVAVEKTTVEKKGNYGKEEKRSKRGDCVINSNRQRFPTLPQYPNLL
jgi:ribosomal small subunit protein bTHX